MFLILWPVIFCTVPFLCNGEDSTFCKAGYHLGKDRLSGEETCFPCEPGQYMSDEKHRNKVCSYCDEEPLPGEWKEVLWPCTWTSNTKIGCMRKKGYESYRLPGRDDCKPCTVCLDGEIETEPCEENHNRKCETSSPTPIPKETAFGIDNGDSIDKSIDNAKEMKSEKPTTSPSTKPNSTGNQSDHSYQILYACLFFVFPFLFCCFNLNRPKNGGLCNKCNNSTCTVTVPSPSSDTERNEDEQSLWQSKDSGIGSTCDK